MTGICVTFADSPTTRDSLSIVTKLGEGKFSTYAAYSPRHDKKYCLKVFPNNEFGTTQYQNEKVLANFNHPNVIQYVPLKCNSPKFHGVATEVAKYGDFFDFVTKGCLNTETLVRTYFHQLIAGIEHIHSQGFAHLDLKLENLMLGSQFTLKIIDFDQTQCLSEKEIKSAGTEGYRAPEVISGRCQNFKAADIYSAGVILYAFLAKEFPFVELEEADPEDMRCYSSFYTHNKRFWKVRALNLRSESLFSSDFIRLVNGMLHPNPAKRFDLKEVKASKWYNGSILSKEDLTVQIKERRRGLRRRKEKLPSLNKN